MSFEQTIKAVVSEEVRAALKDPAVLREVADALVHALKMTAEAGRVLTDAEAGERIGVSARTVARLKRKGDIPSVERNGIRRVRVMDVEEYLSGVRSGAARTAVLQTL